MTLAALFCVCVFHSMMAMPLPAASLRQAAAQDGTTGQTSTATTPTQTQSQTSPSSTQSAPASTSPAPSTSAPSTSGASQTPATQSAQKPTAAHPVHHKKKPVQANCTPPASKPGAAGSSTSDSAANKSGTAQAASGTNASAPSNCPPIKVVVRQGGTTEPSIELAGSEDSSQASRDRKAANQMLSVTQQNLKKIEGRTLTASQQDTVKQIRQFMDQSNRATTDGDLDRARTLAWKAQLLSEDLVNPKK